MTKQSKNSKITFSNHPKRDKIIQRDEIISLLIDLHLLSADEFISKHCSKKYNLPIKIILHKKN